MAAAESAVADSGIDFSKYPPEECGVLIGSGIGGLNEFETQHETMLTKGPSRISPFTIPKLMVNAGSGQVSIRYGPEGDQLGGRHRLRLGEQRDRRRLQAHPARPRRRDDHRRERGGHHPDGPGRASPRCGPSRPGTTTRPGPAARSTATATASSWPKGPGILILEAEEIALARGARIYAEMLGYGMSADGTHITAPDEEGRGARRAMELCLADARCPTDAVDYINMHGTSTGLGDLAETKAIKSVFGPYARKLQVSSTKSQLGHLLGASGGVELVACSLAIRDGVLPPTINLDNPDPECDLDYIPNVAREVRVDHVMSNSFGFGGHNASLLIGRYPGKAR